MSTPSQAPGPRSSAPPRSAPSANRTPRRRGLLSSAADDARSRIWTIAGELLPSVLAVGACGLAAWHIGAYLWIASQRLSYPYAIEWMEGGTLEHVARLLEGKPLYVAPSLDFTPFIYTPLYYWVCTPFAKLFGATLPSLRLVSFAASLCVFVLLFAIVFTRTKNRVASFITLGCFACCFEVFGGWLDLARVDSLALAFLLLGTYVLMRGDRNDAWAGAWFALAFLTKQSMAIVVFPLVVARFFTQRGARRVTSGLVFAAIVVASSAIATYLTRGQYRYYVFDLPAQHPWYSGMRREFWRGDIFVSVPFACAATLYVLFTRAALTRQAMLWGAAIGFIAVSWLLRLHAGGSANVLMPLMAFFAWALGETLHRASTDDDESADGTWFGSLRSSSSLFGIALCIAHMGWLLYTPQAHVPTRDERRSSDALVKYLKTIDGKVLALFDPALARLAGKQGSAHQQAITDIMLGRNELKKTLIEQEIRATLKRREYAAVVVNSDSWYRPELLANYTLAPRQEQTAITKEGAPSHALETWLRKTTP